jgi:CheY-like chemotaxis protein
MCRSVSSKCLRSSSVTALDGFAVVAALQKETGWRDIPVIVITSLDLDAKDRARLNSGVQSVLVKERF